MIDIDNIKAALNVMNVSDENKNIILLDCQVLSNFRYYLSKKYSISYSDADAKIQSYMHSKIDMLDTNGVDNAIEISYQYALSEGFQYSEQLKEAIIRLNRMLMIS